MRVVFCRHWGTFLVVLVVAVGGCLVGDLVVATTVMVEGFTITVVVGVIMVSAVIMVLVVILLSLDAAVPILGS
jgi:hypothetical protein